MNDVDRNTLQSMAEHLKRYSDGGQHQHIPGPSAGACWDYAKEIELVLSRCRKTSLESDSEWYERERASFIVWWESEGEKKFGATPTMAAGAGWFARAEAACGEADSEPLGRAFDQALAECTGSILSQYAANLIRKRANAIAAMSSQSAPSSEE